MRIAHLVTPALATEYGVKGLGEGGAIAPPAAIANAVADAFADLARRLQRDAADPAPRCPGDRTYAPRKSLGVKPAEFGALCAAVGTDDSV